MQFGLNSNLLSSDCGVMMGNNGVTPLPTPEDLRTAASVKISLSTNLMTIALALLGAVSGISVFVLDKKEQLFWFYAAVIAVTLLLVASIFFGGKGIHNCYRKGAAGDWSLSGDKGRFDLQAKLCLGGALLVVALPFLGAESKPESNEVKHLFSVETQLRDLQKEVRQLQGASVATCFKKDERPIPLRPTRSAPKK
jgi:hypothetical protein